MGCRGYVSTTTSISMVGLFPLQRIRECMGGCTWGQAGGAFCMRTLCLETAMSQAPEAFEEVAS